MKKPKREWTTLENFDAEWEAWAQEIERKHKQRMKRQRIYDYIYLALAVGGFLYAMHLMFTGG